MNRARSVETVVIGAGQAGLALSWFLRQAGREHVVLERRTTLGGGWQDRWDAFCLVSPNWTTGVPGFDYDGDDPDGYMPRDEIVARFRRYATAIAAPVELGIAVTGLTRTDPRRPGFRLETSGGPIEAREVIVAAGGFHAPKIPAAASGFGPRILQLHSHQYRNADALPHGAVLVVGTGQSGVQLAEELQAAGRQVFLSVGHCGRAPRRYRDRDIFWWLRQFATKGPSVGAPLPTVDRLPDPRMRFACNPHLSGHAGGHTTNLRRFAADGMRLVGRFESGEGERARFAADLTANLRFADGFFDERLRPLCETLIERLGLELPPHVDDPFVFEPPEVTELDLAAEGISTVLFTSGYRLDFSWIDLPIFEESGLPVHVRGVTEVPGLTFIGLPWQYSMGSANLVSFAQDAAYLAERWS
ncbi:MAG TPA: NAD(P)-binding domain-containing protein [Candidatus Limnocylindrales bacterium]|nr:NAD(P)-binding domain-containing protein [Candidatus Limnocylindrales bacterium]